jgi:hypothetical protein
VAVILGTLAMTALLGRWLNADPDPRVHSPATVAAASGGTPVGGGSSPSVSSASPARQAAIAPIEPLSVGRHALVAEGVPFSLRVPAGGWWRYGDLSISKSLDGAEPGGRSDAEAIIFWTDVYQGDYASACGQWWGAPDGSAADWASSAARADGTELVRRSRVVLGGRPANHVVLSVREDVGCDPGFFHTWRKDLARGPVWTRTAVGDTVRIWLVHLGGKLLYVEADTHRHPGPLNREIGRIIRSIRFAVGPAADPNAEIAERFMAARNVHDVDTALSLLVAGQVKARLMYDNRMAPQMPAVRLRRKELALAFEAERALDVWYGSYACRGEPSPGHEYVVCSYTMDDRLRRVQGYAPLRSWFLLGLRNHRIDMLSFPWLSISYNPGGIYPAESESFVRWLQVEHPDAIGTFGPGELFRKGEGQEMILRLRRESVVLLNDYLDEYEASMSA